MGASERRENDARPALGIGVLPGDQTRRFAQREAMMPGFCFSAHSTTSRMPRDSQCECRHRNPGIVSGWLKMIVSDPGASVAPPLCSDSHGQRTDHLLVSGSRHAPRRPRSSITPAKSSVRKSSFHRDHHGFSLDGRPRFAASGAENPNHRQRSAHFTSGMSPVISHI